MPPKKKNNKKVKSGVSELTADDMRRMGMNEEDVQRILNERSKTDEEKKAEQVKAEEVRRQQEQRLKVIKEINKELEMLVDTESQARVNVLTEEDAEWIAEEPAWSSENARALRSFREKEAIRKAEDARRKREAEVAAYQAALSEMSEEEKQALLDLRAEEREEMMNKIIAKEARRARRERREARRLAKREAALLAHNNSTENGSHSAEVGGSHISNIEFTAGDNNDNNKGNNDNVKTTLNKMQQFNLGEEDELDDDEEDDDDDDDDDDSMNGKARRAKKGAVVQREMNKLSEEDFADMTDKLLSKVY